jgi:hypothetical protein
LLSLLGFSATKLWNTAVYISPETGNVANIPAASANRISSGS